MVEDVTALIKLSDKLKAAIRNTNNIFIIVDGQDITDLAESADRIGAVRQLEEANRQLVGVSAAQNPSRTALFNVFNSISSSADVIQRLGFCSINRALALHKLNAVSKELTKILAQP